MTKVVMNWLGEINNHLLAFVKTIHCNTPPTLANNMLIVFMICELVISLQYPLCAFSMLLHKRKSVICCTRLQT